ncbi:MAG: hypothetical protein KDA71_05390 [Planctomycetales bacterium]|nr:hypothetical protein [Planctomycetales bacterium]
MQVKLIGGVEITTKIVAPSALLRGQLFLHGNTPVIAKTDAASGAPVSVGVTGGIYEANDIDATPPVAGSTLHTDATDVNGAAAGKHLGVALTVTASKVVFLHRPNGA